MKVNSNDLLSFGFWSPTTSSVDWCEPNYVHTPYIAETWNTITNSIYIILTIYGFITSSRLKSPFPLRFKLIFGCFAVVGTGSILFHATLQRWAQLVDELPMLYLISLSLFITVCADPSTSILKQIVWTILSSGMSVLISIYMYMFPEQPDAFFISFAVITSSTFLLTLYRFYDYEDVPRFWSESTFFLLFGLSIWMLENHFCHSIEFLKFHSFWHFFSAVGAFRYGRVCQYVHYKMNFDPNIKIEAKGLYYFLPYLVESSKKE